MDGVSQSPKGTYREVAESVARVLFGKLVKTDWIHVDTIESALQSAAASARKEAIEETRNIFLDYDYDQACEETDKLLKE